MIQNLCNKINTVTSYFQTSSRHFTFSQPTPFQLPIFPGIFLFTRPDSSKTLALYKSSTYLLTYLTKLVYALKKFERCGVKQATLLHIAMADSVAKCERCGVTQATMLHIAMADSAAKFERCGVTQATLLHIAMADSAAYHQPSPLFSLPFSPPA